MDEDNLHDTAIIKQLMPLGGKWEFHFMFRNGNEDAVKLHRLPMLGVALVDFPHGEDEYEQKIVRFGEGWGGGNDFMLYDEAAWLTPRFLYPFFQDDHQNRALGFAPVGSPDDYFQDAVGEATDQLEGENLYGEKLQYLYRCNGQRHGLSYAYFDDVFTDSLSKYFQLVANCTRSGAGKNEWAKVVGSLKEIRETSGDQAALDAVLAAGVAR